MNKLTSIAAVAENGVIGVDGDMPWHISEDFKHFKATTMGHPMIMGRTTFESMGALPGRRSIVITRDPEYAPALKPGDDVIVVHSMDEALEEIAGEDAFVAGGAQVYDAMMEYVTNLIISEIPQSPAGDTHFPEISPQVWQETSRDPRDGFTIVTYERKTP